MSKLSQVTVLGAGSWGTALALCLARNNHKVILWGRDSTLTNSLKNDRENKTYLPGYPLLNNISPQNDLSIAISASQYLVLAAPATAIRNLVEEIVKETGDISKGIICTAKGIEQKSGLAIPQVITEVTDDCFPTAYLSGPSFATEVAEGMPTAVTIASTDNAFSQQVATLFHSETFRVYTSNDVLGIALAGAIKNVIAIAAGIADGMGFATNTRAALITRGLSEIRRFTQTIGIEDETLYGLAGLGDLILTCSDDKSRNRRLGLLLAQNKSVEEIQQIIGQTIEGVNTAKIICQVAEEKQIDLPICKMVYTIIKNEISVQEAVEKLLSRPFKAEY